MLPVAVFFFSLGREVGKYCLKCDFVNKPPHLLYISTVGAALYYLVSRPQTAIQSVHFIANAYSEYCVKPGNGTI